MTRTFSDSDPDGATNHLQNYDYERLSGDYSHIQRVDHLDYLKDCNYSKKYFIKFLLRAIDNSDDCVIDVLFEYFKVPVNLTLKEKITYFQLLGD